MSTFSKYLESVTGGKRLKIGDVVKYKNGEMVTIVKIRHTTVDHDLKGRKIKPHADALYTVEFSDGERQTTGAEEFQLPGTTR